MLDHQGPAMVVGEVKANLRHVLVPFMEILPGPKHLVALVAEEAAMT